MQEKGLGEVWDRLQRATDNDAPLLAFLQQLLSLDPAARADFATLAQHPYLRLDQPHIHVSTSSMAAAAAASATVEPAVVMPDEAALRAAVMSIPTGMAKVSKDRSHPYWSSSRAPCTIERDDAEAERMVAVPGIPFLVFDPIGRPVCETASGTVFR